MIESESYDTDTEDDLGLEGDGLPLESRRSCELGVECYNLRNSILEADKTYNYSKKVLKTQKYVLLQAQNIQVELQQSILRRDEILKEKRIEANVLKIKIDNAATSKQCMTKSFVQSEHCHKNILDKFSHLEIENCTLKSTIAAQENRWMEQFTSMELILLMDAQQAERERDELDMSLVFKENRIAEADKVLLNLNDDITEFKLKCESLKKTNNCLEDKCVWGLEFEKAYNALHNRLEESSKVKDSAMNRILRLEKERDRIEIFASSEGVQLPTFIDVDNEN